MFIIAGPCVVESKEMLRKIAGHVKEICVKLDVEYIFKASYRKANRSSISSFTGIGDEKALNYLAEIGEEFDVASKTLLADIDELISHLLAEGVIVEKQKKI